MATRRRNSRKGSTITSLWELITVSKSFKASAFEGTDEERQVVQEALRILSRAAFRRLLFVPFLLKLHSELEAFMEASSRTSSLLEALLLTRDEGMRGMEEVAGNLLSDDAFAKPFGLLRLYLRPTSSAKFLRERYDPTLPPQLFEVLNQLLDWTENRLTECGEPLGQRKRGRPPEHPAIIEATKLLSSAGFSPGRIVKAIGNQIAVVREHTRRTRNGKSYEMPRDILRTLRRHRGKKGS